MVFKPFTTLARQSISKHLVNGYTQSLVAASQSSYASSTLPIRIGQTNAPAKIQNAFGGAHSGRAAPGKDGSGNDIVNSFYAVQSQLDDKEDKKYLFSRKILWSKAQHQQQQKQLLGNPPEPIAEPLPTLPHVSAVEGAGVEAADADAEAAEPGALAANTLEELLEEESGQSTESTVQFSEDAIASEPPSVTTEYNLQLQTLRDQGRWNEVAALFQHMVAERIPANTATYNLVLDSIVSLHPRYVSQVIDVYQAMLREKLSPNTGTYTILINFLAARALRSREIATEIERDAARFGITLPSMIKEVDEMRSEGALDYALDLFYASTEVRTERAYPGRVYEVLVYACSKYRRDDHMLKVYSHMESHGIVPTPQVIKSMIRGFGRTGNIRPAVETYNCWLEMAASKDPNCMDERYLIYTALIKSYIETGDAAGALSFLEKVVDISYEPRRLEWLKHAVVEGFVIQGDIQSAMKWTARLSIELAPIEWLSRLMTSAADRGELEFTLQLYNSLNFESMDAERVQIQRLFADCQMASLALNIRNREVVGARQVWNDLWKSGRASVNVIAAIGYTLALVECGHPHEAVVVLGQFSRFWLDRQTDGVFSPSNTTATDLQEGYESLIVLLSDRGLLTPSIALDVSGFSFQNCGALGPKAIRCVIGLFDSTRLLGLSPEQLQQTIRMQVSVMQMCLDQGVPLSDADCRTFETMFNIALKPGFPISESLAMFLNQGVLIVAQAKPDIQAKWFNYMYQPSAPTPETLTQVSPIEMSPTLVASEDEMMASTDKNYNPYWETTDDRTSNAIDTTLERSKYTKIPDLRRMYRNTRRAGKSLRLATLGQIVTVTSRNGLHNDFIEEIIRNARVDTPLVLHNANSKFGWGSLLDAMISAQLNMGNREKATEYHNEMLQMGSSPSANTYGLYIVSLKSTHQTYDEASEAVAIFERAMAENVLPTPFLYNAVIGKLAKARRVDDCLMYFAAMRATGIQPTSVTYGTMINALTRVGDESFAEELFKEMEQMPNYKPRPAPYNSLIQFFITTKRDRSKVLSYYNRMLSIGIAPTGHTYKLLIEAYATLEEPDMAAAEAVLDTIKANGLNIESSHHAALIHAKGCILHDVAGATKHFEGVIAGGKILPDSTLYQALLECFVANRRVADTPYWVHDMARRRIQMTPYIANTLIHGWALEKNISRARDIYEALESVGGRVRREPSTYEAMTRAYLAVEDSEGARRVATEMVRRGYPPAVNARVLDLVKAGPTAA